MVHLRASQGVEVFWKLQVTVPDVAVTPRLSVTTQWMSQVAKSLGLTPLACAAVVATPAAVQL
jgi:hypothetical protein